MIFELYALAGVWLILVLLISAQGAATPMSDADAKMPHAAGNEVQACGTHKT